MLDVKMVRANPDQVREALRRRGAATSPLDEFLAVEEERRRLTTEVESMRAERKRASEAIGARKKAGEDASAEIAATRELGDRIKAREAELAVSEARLHELLLALPNIPLADVPEGGEDDSVVLREVGERPAFDFAVKDHLDLGVALDVIDMERAAKVSGSRFAYLKGDLVLLEFALVHYGLDAVMAHGFRPVLPPVLVREEAMYGTGFFPTDEQQIYRTTDGDCLVGTSEVPLAGLHMDEFLEAEALPLRYAGYSTCFRREAGAAGKDTRGILRVHQFDKLEMFSFCLPEQAERRARAHPLDRRGDPAGPRHPLPRGQHRRRRPGRAGRQEVRLRGLDARPAALPRGHELLELHRLPGAPPELPLPHRARPALRAHPERHRPSPWAARSSPSWRTTSAPTAPSPCRPPSCPTWARRRSAAESFGDGYGARVPAALKNHDQVAARPCGKGHRGAKAEQLGGPLAGRARAQDVALAGGRVTARRAPDRSPGRAPPARRAGWSRRRCRR